MHEQRRQYYLSTLGVESYVPRRVLSGAAPSQLLAAELLQPHILDEPNETAVPAVVAAATVFDVAPVSSINSITTPAAVFEAPVVESQVETSVSQFVSVEKIEDSKPQTITFLLSIWRVGDCLIVDSRQPGTALPTDKLLQNMLRAVGYPVAQLPALETIRWPLFVNKSISSDPMANDAAQAAAMVQAYISAQQAKSPIQYLLLMGEDAVRYALNTDALWDELAGTLLTESSLGMQVLITPSLFTMLQAPLQKVIAWRALKQIITSPLAE
jgi:hypothetical protein